MSNDTPKSIGTAFASFVRRVLICAALSATIIFAVTTERLLHRRTALAALEQARLCATVLTPGANGDLSDPVDHLRARYDRLVAVAILTPSGGIQTVYADGPGYRGTIVEAARANSCATTATANGRTVWRVSVPLNGRNAPDAWRALFVLRHDSYVKIWLIATAICAAIMGVGLAISLRALTWWFGRSVTAPLRRLSRPAVNLTTVADPRSTARSGPWYETEQIARKFCEFGRKIELNEARCRQAERNAEEHVRRYRRRLDRRLRRAEDQATMDPLTALRNRRFLDEELEALFEDLRARGADLAVIMIDVDNFKDLNDTQGHDAGDEILQFLGELLRAAIRPTDHAVRYGGDETVLLLPNVNAKQARTIAERIVRLFAQYVSPVGSPSPLSLSAGVATLKSTACVSGHELITRADEALYNAKRRGKNTVSVSAVG